MDDSLKSATGASQMEDDKPDSRNAAFKRFRDVDPNNSPDSDNGSNYKRRRVSAPAPKQESASGANPSRHLGTDSPVTSTSHGQGLAPARFNWNAGTKITIGTSLKNRKRTNNVDTRVVSSSTDAADGPNKTENDVHVVHPSEDNPKGIAAEPPFEPQSELPAHYGSDDGVVLNLTSHDQESGEISETTSREGVAHRDPESEAENEPHDYPVDIRGGSDTEEHDDMEEYANADQVIDTVSTDSQLGAKPRSSGTALTLAHLKDEDLRAQMRYFHVAQDSKIIDFMATSVKCLVCFGEGHMASSCPKLTCADCGEYNDHFPPFCPVSQRCPRCHERGHDQVDCRSKLRVLASQGTCDLCSTTGHIADDCELLWRTSGPPAVVSVTDSRLKRLSCYECGQPHHLGNDCPSRRPGKPLGTSTWSIHLKSHIPDHISIRSSGEMSIKGRARQSRPISIESDSEDERNHFVRPKLPAPKTGQIRIQAPRPTSTWSAVNEPRRDPSRYTHKQASTHLRPYRERDVSPRQRVFDPNGRANWHQPPLPREPIPSGGNRSSHYDGGGERYRPMPSAGPNAWRQHRI